MAERGMAGRGMAGRGTEPSRRDYAALRDFAQTREPPPDAAPVARTGRAPVFVVQKHHASRLHWDFRLEHGGVLWSWAVPKGPSLDPHDKRLAMHVEDHPVSYATFEGSIPDGNYGAGTVAIWDRGTWEPVRTDAAAALADGELKFRLDGARLRGGFVLVRLKPRARERGEGWLLIKEHDAHERAGVDAAALERVPLDAPKRARRPRTTTKAAAKTSAKTSTGIGTPSSVAWPIQLKPGLISGIGTPPL